MEGRGMKVHLRQIPQGGTLHLEDEEDPAYLGLEEGGAQPVSPLHYSLDLGVSDGGVFATGSLHIRIKQRCVACLEEFEDDLAIDPFGIHKELVGNEEIDLSDEVREDIQLALPAYPRCDAGGQRSCPASFPRASSASQPSSDAAWSALDQLKTEKSKN